MTGDGARRRMRWKEKEIGTLSARSSPGGLTVNRDPPSFSRGKDRASRRWCPYTRRQLKPLIPKERAWN